MKILPGSPAASGSSTVISGNAAEDAATTANPVIVGGVVRTASSPTTLVAGDAARVTMSSAGSVVTLPYAVPESTWSFASSAITTATAITAKAAVASYRNYVSRIQLSTLNPGAVGTLVEIRDGAGGTVLWRGVAPVADTADITLEPPLRQAAVNTLIEINPVYTAGTVYVSIQGFVAL